MAQHFLLSAAARTLSLKAIYKAGEEAAHDTFCKMRWPETDGEAVCPDCSCCETFMGPAGAAASPVRPPGG